MSLKITFTQAAVTGAALLGAAVITPAVAHATEPLGAPARRAVQPITALQPLSSLIGSWKCTGVVTSPDGSTKQFDVTSTAKFILKGNFMRWQETATIGGTPISSAEYIYGWDAQHQRFTTDRFDDAGQRGSQTSPGWVGNVLTATGNLVQPGGTAYPMTTTLTSTGRKAFTVRAVVELGAAQGAVTVVSESSCSR